MRAPLPRRLLAGAAILAGATATLIAPTAASADTADITFADQVILPPGVIRLNDGEVCPPSTLCLYRDYGNSGPAYGIGAGYVVNLGMLPMPGGVGGPTAANNVSSWVNNTGFSAFLVDADQSLVRSFYPQQSMAEPIGTNDSVDVVAWG